MINFPVEFHPWPVKVIQYIPLPSDGTEIVMNSDLPLSSCTYSCCPVAFVTTILSTGKFTVALTVLPEIIVGYILTGSVHRISLTPLILPVANWLIPFALPKGFVISVRVFILLAITSCCAFNANAGMNAESRRINFGVNSFSLHIV